MAEKDAASRREFLSLASAGAAAAGVAAATAAAPAEAAAAGTPAGEGYRETPHVKAYLESCRF